MSAMRACRKYSTLEDYDKIEEFYVLIMNMSLWNSRKMKGIAMARCDLVVTI